ncbi:unnamed protein product [Lactuca virosa]|uniref:ATP-dependent DNA helicase n=1 Tax=Lactuca virosa TaxID=75947 RepID=A0AAU9NN82_9ASTR|nr:unnamed protein product [Lactuca virosa]
MAERNTTLIKDLDNMNDDYTLKVSIIRLWRSISDVNPTIVKSIEMILMDEMECLQFQSKSTYGFSCVSFKTIISTTTTSNDSVDVIGEVVSLGKLDSRNVNKSKHRLHLQIRNLEGLQVNVTLFGEIGYQLISYVENHKEIGCVIVLLQFAKINVYNGLPSVNSHFDHTRMFINVDLLDIFGGLRGLQNPSSSLIVDTSQSYSEYDDFLIKHNFKNVVDFHEPREVGKFIIVGTIYGIRQDIDWYYNACTKCGRKVNERNVFTGPESGDASVLYECFNDKCADKKISSVPRYKILIRVQDDSGTITLTLFDRDAYKLVKTTASSLIEKIKQSRIRKEVFFVYGYGGTGKTILWKTISTAIRCNGEIVLNVASSGIASLLLPGGRIAHSWFIIPLNLTEDYVCKIPPDSELGRLVRKSSLIIWDEAPMVHKHAFEALDRSLKDVCRFDKSSNSNIPFGGKVIVFG